MKRNLNHRRGQPSSSSRVHHGYWFTFAVYVLLQSTIVVTNGQDILRQRLVPQQQQQNQQQPALSMNSNQQQQQQQPNNDNQLDLSDFKLPPQLASLTPEQLHQLAQIRELQIKQQQQQQQQQAQSSNQPTPQPNVVNNGQIPQPNGANTQPANQQPVGSSNSNSNNNNNNNNAPVEDGSYKEAESEMEGITSPKDQPNGANQANTGATGSSGAAAAQPTFEVNWNKCPQLEPSETEKNKKTQVITKCLQSAPIPTNLTRENVETHREQIATCALKSENWFDDKGSYRYDKAEAEIRAKGLDSQIEVQVLKFHVACKSEAMNKFPREQHKLIDQVQFYQACMDYYISIVCEIEVSVDQ